MRRRASGTHVPASTEDGRATASIAAASASATARQPENFSLRIAARAGPAYRNGARAESIDTGGQSRHRSTGRDHGRPQRSHHGGSSDTRADRQSSQNGHGPRPHPAHRAGNSVSRARSSNGDIMRRTVSPHADTPSGDYGSLTSIAAPAPRT